MSRRPGRGGQVRAGSLRTYVVNLRRRADRRARMKRILPKELEPDFTSDWDGPFDGADLDRRRLEAVGYRTFPWQINSSNPWWSRPLKLGEIGCTLSHLACWQHAADTSAEHILILEDDVILGQSFLTGLLTSLRALDGRSFDLLYLGRYPLEPDKPAGPGLVSPGYSHCTYAYLLRRSALRPLLDARLDQAIVPVDEFLPSLCIDHPRADLRTRFPRRLRALAVDPPLVRQLPKQIAGVTPKTPRSSARSRPAVKTHASAGSDPAAAAQATVARVCVR